MSFINLFPFDNISQIFLVFSIAFYLVECYAGYKCIKAFVAIVGFLIGFAVGFLAMSKVYTQNAYIPAVIGLIAGVVLAIVAFKLYLFGVFILCGALAARAVLQLPFGDGGTWATLRVVVCIAAFLIVGILAVKFAKLCIILVTSITGAVNAVTLLGTPVEALGANMVLRIAVTAFVAITGILVQRATTKKSR